jgi:hypothetical protein
LARAVGVLESTISGGVNVRAEDLANRVRDLEADYRDHLAWASEHTHPDGDSAEKPLGESAPTFDDKENDDEG